MKIDYSGFLLRSADGHLWWLLDDAIRLAVGYRPESDQSDGTFRLRAPNERVGSDEKLLAAAWEDGQFSFQKPTVKARPDGNFVKAGDFLAWLSQYLTLTQAQIPFPAELVKAVRDLPPAPVKEVNKDLPFQALTDVLADWFGHPLSDIPEALGERIRSDLHGGLWDDLSPDQRRSAARQWDYQHDPATEADRKFWWDFFVRKDDIEKQIYRWEAVSAPTASDLRTKEERLAELRKDLDRMERQLRDQPGDSAPRAKPVPVTGPVPAESAASEPVSYLAYPKALKKLTARFPDTSPEEVAAWLFFGPDCGGLAAYTNANELDPPPRFYYAHYMNERNFLAPLMACWFRKENIEAFSPTDRYMTGKALIERWAVEPGVEPKAFIAAKIREDRLQDCHPTLGTVFTSPGVQDDLPPMEEWLFPLSQIQAIEDEDFGDDEPAKTSSDESAQDASAAEIKAAFQVLRDPIENQAWWAKRMRNAKQYGLSVCRVGSGATGRRGSRWRPDLIAGWLVDRTENRALGMSPRSARNALKSFPEFADLADQLFPSED